MPLRAPRRPGTSALRPATPGRATTKTPSARCVCLIAPRPGRCPLHSLQGSSPARFARSFRSEALRLVGVRRIHPTEGSPAATHATEAANLVAFHPVQLTLQLCSQRPGSPRAARPRLAYWGRVDLADIGGHLEARNHGVRVLLPAHPDCASARTGYYNALFFSNTGVSGPTRPMPSRLDALSAAAHEVARHCRRLLGFSAGAPRANLRAAPRLCAGSRSLSCSSRGAYSASRPFGGRFQDVWHWHR